MRELILFSMAAGLLSGLMPRGRLSECAQMALGLTAVRLVCGLLIGLLRII